MTSDYTTHITEQYNLGANDYANCFTQSHDFLIDEREIFFKSIPSGEHILDCGCGPGWEAKSFQDNGFKVTGIDLSREFINLARINVPNMDFTEMDMRNLTFAGETFSGIWASFSFLHIQYIEILNVLAGFYRVLKPKGLLMLALHSNDKTEWKEILIAGMKRYCYVQEWNITELEEIISETTFKIIHKRQFSRPNGQYPLFSLILQKQ